MHAGILSRLLQYLGSCKDVLDHRALFDDDVGQLELMLHGGLVRWKRH